MESPSRTRTMKKYIIRRPFPPIPRCLTLDGGFATQLTEHVGNRVDGDPLWSARFNATNPAAVQQTHLDFLRAGAQVISTNTYQATVVGYMHHLDLLPVASADLIRSTIALAKEAREQYLDEVYEAAGPESPPKSHDEYEADDGEYTVKVDYSVPLIVGSIGPYGAHLNDGSEYTGDYADRVTKEEIMQYHRHRMQIMAEEGVDAVAIETVPCALEADALVELMTGEYSSLRFWMSFQCKEDGVHLAHGEVFADVAHAVWQKVNGDGVVVRAEEPGEGQLMAVGVNCLNPALVSGLLKALDAKRKPHEPVIPSVIYPNSGELYSVAEGWTGKANCVALHEYVPEWIELGARFIGGCCRTYARDITPIAEQVKKANDAAAAAAEAAAAAAAAPANCSPHHHKMPSDNDAAATQQVPPLLHTDQRPKCTELLQLGADGIRQWLTTFDDVLTDCDGVLWLHNTAIAGSADVIARLQALGKRVFLVTNNSSRTRAQFAAKAVQLEYNVSAEQIVSTAHVAAKYLHERLAATDRAVYVIGSEGITSELDALGVRHCGFGPDPGTTLAQLSAGEFQPDPSVGAVIVGFDEHFGFAKLCKAATYLQQPQCEVFVATSIDQRSPVRGACIPGTGALLRSVEEVSGRRAVVLGKPDPLVVQALMREHNIRADRRTLMIGDRCNTDVALGRNCGFQTLLVGTGISQLADVERCGDGEVPDWFLPRLGDLAEWLK